MNDSEAELYLANVVTASRASGTLTPDEEELLEEVRTSIKAKKSVLKAAVRRAEDHEVDLTQFARFSDRVRNLEDMIEMVLCDGQLDDSERTVVISAAKQIGITQEQLNLILKEAKRRRASRSPKCGKCDHELSTPAKFCPECGAAMDEAGPVKAAKNVDIQVASDGITIAFAESSSASFSQILSTARSFSSFHEVDRGGKRWFGLSVGHGDVSQALELIALLSNLRNREVYVRGKSRDWRDVFGFASCAKDRSDSYRPVEYCFGLEDNRVNPWGCKQIGLDWTAWSDLFTFGKFTSTSVFEFDIDRIRHELENRAASVQLCPHLRPRFIAAVLESFPREATIKPKGEWRYRRTYDADPRAIKVVVKERSDGFTYTDEFFAIGVEPADSSVLQSLMQSALKKCAQSDVELRKLLK
jgi:uncharacterized tellurite resistance protein B-like protein